MPDAFFRGIADTLRQKRDLLGDGLRTAGFDVSLPAGGYFTVADAAPLGALDAAEFCRALPVRAGVVAIPLTAFVTPARRPEYATLVRFAACKRVDVLEDAASRLAALAV
jgi:N-succinyldiaminopimelate aminotransferase